MKNFALLFGLLLSIASYGADDIIVPENSGNAFLQDANGLLFPATITYTTDGDGHLHLINSNNPVDDDIIVPDKSGKAYLNGADGNLYPVVVTYTTDGNGNVIPIPAGGGGGGGVSSVALGLPSSVFNISGSPITTSGTLTGAFKTQSANTIFAGPTSGSAAVPAFRSLVAADIPSLTASKISDFSTAVAASIGFTPENVANKATSLSTNDNTHYPTTAAVTTAISAIPAATPAGPTGAVQTNNGSGAFAGTANFTYSSGNLNFSDAGFAHINPSGGFSYLTHVSGGADARFESLNNFVDVIDGGGVVVQSGDSGEDLQLNATAANVAVNSFANINLNAGGSFHAQTSGGQVNLSSSGTYLAAGANSSNFQIFLDGSIKMTGHGSTFIADDGGTAEAMAATDLTLSANSLSSLFHLNGDGTSNWQSNVFGQNIVYDNTGKISIANAHGAETDLNADGSQAISGTTITDTATTSVTTNVNSVNFIVTDASQVTIRDSLGQLSGRFTDRILSDDIGDDAIYWSQTNRALLNDFGNQRLFFSDVLTAYPDQSNGTDPTTAFKVQAGNLLINDGNPGDPFNANVIMYGLGTNLVQSGEDHYYFTGRTDTGNGSSINLNSSESGFIGVIVNSGSAFTSNAGFLAAFADLQNGADLEIDGDNTVTAANLSGTGTRVSVGGNGSVNAIYENGGGSANN